MQDCPLFKVHVPRAEALRNIRLVIESGYVNEGVQVSELTTGLQQVLGAERLLLTNSCTSALTIALRLSGVGPGTAVVSTPQTCVATNTPIVNAGAAIEWADIDPGTGMLDVESVSKSITYWTRAVVVVAWAGNPPDLQELRALCDKRDVKLILDAAHAFGAEFQQAPIHRFAHFTAYSFQAIKHFSTGDGGALVCEDPEDFRRAKALKWFGLDRDSAKDARGDWKGQQWDADIVEAGYKFNMNNIAAAIGLAQLPRIQWILERHRVHAAIYDTFFADSSVVRPLQRSPDSLSSSWVYTIRTDPAQRDQLLVKLNESGIRAGLVHVPNDQYTAFEAFRRNLPGVREFASSQFSLPCGWWLSRADVENIATRTMELAQ